MILNNEQPMYTNSHISLNVKCTKNHFVAEFCLCHRGAYSIPAHPSVIYRGKRKDGIDKRKSKISKGRIRKRRGKSTSTSGPSNFKSIVAPKYQLQSTTRLAHLTNIHVTSSQSYSTYQFQAQATSTPSRVILTSSPISNSPMSCNQP